MKPYTAVSLFSGAVDGLAIAAQTAGFNVTHHVEWDAWCCRVLRMNHPGSVVINEDIHNVRNLPTVDVIFGGSPCQDFSVAGSRHGFSGERYLWPEMFRNVTESKPYAVVHENVRGGVSAGLLDQICDDLESIGYETKALVYPASVFGAPHERYRKFIVGLMAYTGSQRQQRTTAIAEHHRDQERHTEASQQTGYTVSDAIEPSGEAVAYTRESERSYTSRTAPSNAVEHPERSGLSEYHAPTRCDSQGRGIRGFEAASGNRLHEPGMARNAHGTAPRLHRLDPLTDFPGWPAGQGVYQHAYEPPRTTPQKGKYAKERIQALGNAVVWQQAYPIFKALMMWFESQEASI